MASSKSAAESRLKTLRRVRKESEAEHARSIPRDAWRFLLAYLDLEKYRDDDDVRTEIDLFIERGLDAWIKSHSNAEASQANTQSSPTSGPRSRPTFYGAPQGRRLELLRFVVERVVPLANRGTLCFDTMGHLMPWEQILAEWKKEHPGYLGSATALERQYRRTRADQHVTALYSDVEFRDWATRAEAMRQTLRSFGMVGLRPEDIFAKSDPHQIKGFAQGAQRMLDQARAFRRASKVENVDAAVRKRYEREVELLEGGAQTSMRASKVENWRIITAKLQPDKGRALERAIRRKCGLVESVVAYTREDVLCEGPGCHRCRVGADLVKSGLISAPGGLPAGCAHRATERHRERLDAARGLLKLFGSVRRRPRA